MAAVDETTTTPQQQLLKACREGNEEQVKHILGAREEEAGILASYQDDSDGRGGLIWAAIHGHINICKLLLEAGAPWNACDRMGKCAGNYASESNNQELVDMLVQVAVQAEMILGASIRLMQQSQKKLSADGTDVDTGHNHQKKQLEEEAKSLATAPSVKPDYLSRNVRYEGDALLDEDDDGVMMEWERPLMSLHAQVITSAAKQKRVLNVGFGMGIIDTELQSYDPALHVIIEAHPKVYEKMINDGWDKKPNVRICFGKWQDELPRLIKEGIEFDGIFFDTYGEHFTDLEDFHEMMVSCLVKPSGIYSFFNGLAPDNIFFHGVACECVRLQLAQLNLSTDFASCEISIKEDAWKGIRRKYFHNNVYYLPISTWSH